MTADSLSYPVPRTRRLRGRRATRAGSLLVRPELLALLGLTAVLNLWNLGINGWANTYYSAAVRSMTTSWHDFLFASLDKSGLMTVDKPPLALWVEALSARVFGFHPLSILIPEALMGVAAVALLYDLVQRRFGRAAGFVAGLALASTPITVAIARHNNPDELLVLCSVAALWVFVRALERRSTVWLVLSGVLIGLGFETKMAVALMLVPGIIAAWIWTAPARARATAQLLAWGGALVVVGGAWPLLVTLTPAADRPWISGTADNSVWSLIFGYNGLGRVSGQAGGPGGNGGLTGTVFGGPAGIFRLVQSALGDQAGWLLGFALVAGVAILVLTRLRRRDPRTGWLIATGGAFLTTAVVFSFARGIFHPYYVSLLAPFAAALIGAGAGLMVPYAYGGVGDGRSMRIVAPLAIAGGVVTELVVLRELGGALPWAAPLVLVLGVLCAVALALALPGRARAAVVAIALAALLAAPAVWADETLSHATSSTFPMGGPASVSIGGPGGGAGGAGAFGGGSGAGPRGGSASAVSALFGTSGGSGGPAASRVASGAGGFGPPGAGSFGGPGAGAGFGGPGGFGEDGATVTAAARYAQTHGGGTVAVESQSSAATAILSSDANVAGLGGFSGRESSISAQWLAMEVRSGSVRWLLVDSDRGGTLPGDTRTGSEAVFTLAERVGRRVTFTTSSGTKVTMYDLSGRAAAILAAAGKDR